MCNIMYVPVFCTGVRFSEHVDGYRTVNSSFAKGIIQQVRVVGSHRREVKLCSGTEEEETQQ